MRIACVHVPQFALQSITRIDPSLRGGAVAVVGAGVDPGAADGGRDPVRFALHSPVVLACSRAAWALGVRVGMTAVSARAASPEVRVISADAQLERDTVRAIADALLGLSPVVDLGGRVGPGAAHLAIYCEVPSKTRGGTFGDRLIDRLEAMGLSCRVGIADDRFTAWVAASAPSAPARADDVGVVTVPRGGSAAFLAPRPLSLLAISPEVQHMLEALGVRTLGEFAALPAPSVARPVEADYQALARGDSGTTLRPYAPDLPIREHAALPPGGSLSGPAAVAMLAARLATRLAGRGRGAAKLEIVVGGEAGERTVSLTSGRVLETAEELADALGGAIGELSGAWRLRVAVVGEAMAASAAGAAAAAAVSAAATGAAAAGAVDDGPAAAAAATAAAAGADLVMEPELDALSAVLGADRREGYRRTRHGKRRARTVRGTGSRAETVDPLLQPRLFKM